MTDGDPAVILEASLKEIQKSFDNSNRTDLAVANGQRTCVEGVSVQKLLVVATTPTPADTTSAAKGERERMIGELQEAIGEIRDAAITPTDSLAPLREFVGGLDQEESASRVDLAAGLVALTFISSSLAESYGDVPASAGVSLSASSSVAAAGNDSRALEKAASASEEIKTLIDTARFADQLWVRASNLELPSYADPPTEVGKRLRKAVAEGNRNKLLSIEETLEGAPDAHWDHEAVMSPAPDEFETLLADLWIRAPDTVDVAETRRSNDAGVDVIVRASDGRTILLQAKQHAAENPVGRQTIQQTEGARAQFRADQATVVTTTRFTAPAESAAGGLPHLNLIDGDRLRGLLNRSPLVPPSTIHE